MSGLKKIGLMITDDVVKKNLIVCMLAVEVITIERLGVFVRV